MRKHFGALVVAASFLAASCNSGKGPTGPSPNPLPTTGFRITTTQLPEITPLVGYFAQLEATDGQPPYQFSTSSVPAGINVSLNGTISGMMNGCPGPSAMLSLTATATDQTGATTPATTASFPCRYESLPTKRKYLLDANGMPTHMWVSLLAEPIPARGSTVTLGSGVCASGGCFHNLSLEFGINLLQNPANGAFFNIGFSQDGQNMATRLTGGLILSGKSAQTDTKQIWAFTNKAKYLFIYASFDGDFYDSGESGSIKILTDYK